MRIYRIEYTARSRQKDSMMSKPSFVIQTNMVRTLELPVVFKASNISVIPLRQKVSAQKESTKETTARPNLLVLVWSIVNIFCVCFQLRESGQNKDACGQTYKIKVQNLQFKELSFESSIQ